jgi:BAR domain of APPL family/PH domain
MTEEGPILPKLQAIASPLNLLPVNLKEAALDSPSFRATCVHFGDQFDAVERWLDSYVRAASRLANEVTSIESLVNAYVAAANPPAAISEAALDQDYTLLAVQRYNDGAKEFWAAIIRWMKKVESTVVDPIRNFVHNDMAQLKSIRRTLDIAQKNFDSVIQRYASQSKTKETSSLREDAFQLHEARRAYLKASMDFCVAAPQVRAALDRLLVKIFSDRWREMKNSRDALTSSFAKWTTDIDRVRGWSKEMENHERVFASELQIARKSIEEAAELKSRPPRELDAYSSSTVPYLSNSGALASPKKNPVEISLKQGWLFQRTLTGKPTRTVWIRRWFYVKDGVFGWLQQSLKFSAVEESEKIGVLLCGVRPALQEERRFCFEVKTKNSTLILQAETQAELMEWIAAFEVVKRKALENPTSSGHAGGVQGAPFAITPPVSAEFAAKSERDPAEEGTERASTLGVDALDLPRTSVDTRRPLAGEEGESSKRDAAARLIQKLDLRKGGASSSNSPAMGGIASLIAASHSALPISPKITPSLNLSTDFKKIFSSNIPISSLAPSTMANPPIPTTLSKSAIVVSAERGLSLAQTDDGNIPVGLMANVWGSSNWSYVNRLERNANTQVRNLSVSRPQSRAPSPSRSPVIPPDLKNDEPPSPPRDLPELTHVQSDPTLAQSMHRKSLSVSQDPSILRPVLVDDYPNYYPLPLKAQDAQFRMLFPNVRREDKLVLVFRATWNPSDQQEFPGRVYVTMNDIYFYSNHLGLVLITGVSMDSIVEITSAPGKDCDFLFVHLKEGVRPEGATRITVKTFLESQRLLQKRLDYLVHSHQNEELASLEETIKTMIKMEANTSDDSPLGESWDDIAADIPDSAVTKRGQDLKTSIHIDGSLDPKKIPKNATKFRLPAYPVEFTPQGFKHPYVERQYDVTAKSLFHVLVGDKSAVFPILYCQRGAQREFINLFALISANTLIRISSRSMDTARRWTPSSRDQI